MAPAVKTNNDTPPAPSRSPKKAAKKESPLTPPETPPRTGAPSVEKPKMKDKGKAPSTTPPKKKTFASRVRSAPQDAQDGVGTDKKKKQKKKERAAVLKNSRSYRMSLVPEPLDIPSMAATSNVPATSVGLALRQLEESGEIPQQFYTGIKVFKVCSSGKIVPRILTISRGSFIVFVTHGRVRGGRRRFRRSAAEADARAEEGAQEPQSSKPRSFMPMGPSTRSMISSTGVGGEGAPEAAAPPAKQRVNEGTFWKKLLKRGPGTSSASPGKKAKLTPRHVDISDITHVQHGFIGTRRLELARAHYRSAWRRKTEEAQLLRKEVGIVSIIHHSAQSLDLIIPQSSDRDAFVNALTKIRQTYHSTKVHVGREELLLRYVWYDIDTNRNGLIDVKEILKIMDRLNFQYRKSDVQRNYNRYIKDLNAKAKEEAKGRNEKFYDKVSTKRGLTFAQGVEFLRQHKILSSATALAQAAAASAPPLSGADRRKTGGRLFGAGKAKKERLFSMEDQLWNQIFGADQDVVTEDEFRFRFLHDRQHEEDDGATQEYVRHLFQYLNNLEIVGEEGKGGEVDVPGNTSRPTQLTITRRMFDCYLHSTFNDAYDPLRQRSPAAPEEVKKRKSVAVSQRIHAETRARSSPFHADAEDGDVDNEDSAASDEFRLDAPLSYYWISTSHNTYLTGDQLKSMSSVEMYTYALNRGCKCLEMDCWDGIRGAGKQTDTQASRHVLRRSPSHRNIEDVLDVDDADAGKLIPVIFHGHTLTSKIRFRDVVKCVAAYVDANPDTYPIILSLENHCSKPYQKAMAEILEEELGDRLFVPHRQTSMFDLPSPEDLRGMVVIKGKRPPERDEMNHFLDGAATVDEATAATHQEDDEEDPYDGGSEGASRLAHHESSVASTATATTTGNSPGGKKPKKSLFKIVQELARLTLFHGTKHKSFDESIALPSSHMHSVSENKLARILEKHPSNASKWRHYNIQHLTRTYPAGLRVDSSNYNPLVAWSLGCQLVALNFQTPDASMAINDGWFRAAGRCGYVPKPSHLLRTGLKARSLGTSDPIILKVRVLCASCLPKPLGRESGECIDPYVRIIIHDVTEEGTQVTDDGNNHSSGRDDASTVSSLSTTSNANTIRSRAGGVNTNRSTNTERSTPSKSGNNGVNFVATTRSHSTAIIPNNGFYPVWNEQSFACFRIKSPDVAVVQFSIREKDRVSVDDHICDAAIPLKSLRRGIRAVQMYDSNNERPGAYDFSSLLIDVDYELPPSVGSPGGDAFARLPPNRQQTP